VIHLGKKSKTPFHNPRTQCLTVAIETLFCSLQIPHNPHPRDR